jgi:uncharacterized membrane protein
MTIRNPMEWVVEEVVHASRAIEAASHVVHPADEDVRAGHPIVRRIRAADLREILVKGFDDFKENRTDVVFLCLLYPALGLLFARAASGGGMLQLVFPLASGFALLGPVVGVGLYEMSRLREQGLEGGWLAAFRVVHSPSIGGIVLLGLVLAAIFVIWMAAAEQIYLATLGPHTPESIGAFAREVATTQAGRMMVGIGLCVGFFFALLVLVISIVSFPMMLDRHVGIGTAVLTSLRVVAVNPVPIALWGIIAAGGLVVGSIPLFFGLVIVLPVLGHATWHLYRKVVWYN